MGNRFKITRFLIFPYLEVEELAVSISRRSSSEIRGHEQDGLGV